MSEKKQPVDLGLLEEDDEFEEFPAEDWAGLDEDEDAHVWEDNWDDDNVEDDFSNQLRAELEKHGYKFHLGGVAAAGRRSEDPLQGCHAGELQPPALRGIPRGPARGDLQLGTSRGGREGRWRSPNAERTRILAS